MWTGVEYSSQSHGSDEQKQMKRRAKHPKDVPFQQTVYKELFLLVKTEKYFCFRSQAEQRRLVCWGIRHLTWESLLNTAIPNAAPGPSDVPPAQRNAFLAQGKRLLLHFPAAVKAAPLPCQTQVKLFPGHLCHRNFLTALSSSFSKKSSPGCPVTFRIWVSWSRSGKLC